MPTCSLEKIKIKGKFYSLRSCIRQPLSREDFTFSPLFLSKATVLNSSQLTAHPSDTCHLAPGYQSTSFSTLSSTFRQQTNKETNTFLFTYSPRDKNIFQLESMAYIKSMFKCTWPMRKIDCLCKVKFLSSTTTCMIKFKQSI